MPQLSEDGKTNVMNMVREGYSQVEVARVMKVSSSTISRLVSKYNENGSTSRIIESGRLEKMDKLQKRNIRRTIRLNPSLSDRAVLQEAGLQGVISRWSVGRYMRSINLFSRHARRTL